MGVVITRSGTEIDDCEDATDWSGGTVNDSFQLEGVNCLGEKVSQTTGAENLYTFPGANPDMTGEFIVHPMSVTGQADTLANGGFRIVVEDGNADKGTWYVGGSDTTNERWTYFTVDPSTAPTYINAVLNSDLGISTLTSSGTTATLTTSTVHGLTTGDYVVVTDADQIEYNVSKPIIVSSTTVFTYVMDNDPSDDTATGPYEVRQGIDFTDVDKTGVQMKVLTKAIGNTPNAFWDICWYGSGLNVTSTIDSVTITRSGTTATVADTAHGLAVGDTFRLAGITDKTEDNGDHVITVSNANDYDYETTNSGSTSYTGTITSRVHATWQHVADADAVGFWGLDVQSQGVHFLQGHFTFGSEGAADDLLFVDSNFLCVYRENLFLPPSKNNITLRKHATGDLIEVDLSDGFISAFGTQWGFAGIDTDSNFDPDDITMAGMSFDEFNTFTCGDNSAYTYDRIKFNRFDVVSVGAATMDEITLSNANPGGLGMLYEAQAVNITNVSFTNGGSFHMVFLGLAFPQEITFDNYTFDDSVTDILLALIPGEMLDNAAVTTLVSTGTTATLTTTAVHGLSTNDWVTVSGANESAYNGVFKITVTSTTAFTYVMASDPVDTATGTILVDETLIVNQINGSNANSVAEISGQLEFVSSVPVTITVVDKGTGLPVEDANVQIYLTSDYSTVVLSGTTNASGVVSTTYGGVTPAAIEGWARQVDLIGIDYESVTFIGSLEATVGFSATIELEASS